MIAVGIDSVIELWSYDARSDWPFSPVLEGLFCWDQALETLALFPICIDKLSNRALFPGYKGFGEFETVMQTRILLLS